MRVHAGMARFTCHDPNNVWDLVPCDTVASTILLTAAATSSKACALATSCKTGISEAATFPGYRDHVYTSLDAYSPIPPLTCL